MARIIRDDVDRFFQYDIDISTRTLYMGSVSSDDGQESGVDHQMAERIIKGLHILESQAEYGDKPITIIMNNIGGCEYHGFAIYDAIKSCKNHITIKVYGQAMSMGGIIMQAADERLISPTSRFMAHYGSFSIDANAKDAYKWVEDNKKLDKIMENIFLEKIREKHPKFTRQQLQKLLSADYIIDAKKAVDLGLADEIL